MKGGGALGLSCCAGRRADTLRIAVRNIGVLIPLRGLPPVQPPSFAVILNFTINYLFHFPVSFYTTFITLRASYTWGRVAYLRRSRWVRYRRWRVVPCNRHLLSPSLSRVKRMGNPISYVTIQPPDESFVFFSRNFYWFSARNRLSIRGTRRRYLLFTETRQNVRPIQPPIKV